jgi:hypothetical protein
MDSTLQASRAFASGGGLGPIFGGGERTDHRKRLLGHRLGGGDIIRTVEEALVDLLARYETVAWRCLAH